MRRGAICDYDNKNKVIGIGSFHTWGTELFPGSSHGFVSVTRAVVELDDGTVKLVNPECIKFMPEQTEKQ